MENSGEQEKSELLGMNLDYDGGNTLHEATRWSKIQSIGTLICGGLVLLGLLIGGPVWVSRFGDQVPDGLGIIELIMLLIGLFLATVLVASMFLLRFTSGARKGIQTQDQATFNRGLKNLKIYFIIIGILSLFLLADFGYVLINQFIL